MAVSIALATAPEPTLAQAPESEGVARRVVTLNATDPYLPAFLALDSAVRETIRAQSRAPAELYAEPLDMHRFPRKLLDADVVALLRKKYHDLKVDVVVATAPIALDFAVLHRSDIWPGAAIVFNSIPTTLIDERAPDPDVVGVPLRLEVGETLELALRLRPQTRRIVVVSGTDGQCCGYLTLAREALSVYERRFDIDYIVGLGVAETVAAVRAVPPDAVVLYLAIFRDGDGEPQVPRDVLTRIAAVSPAPIFGLFETYVGYGIVGGSIAGYEAQGRRTGELVARLLNGEEPGAIGIQPPVPSGCIADWRQLRRWDIDADLLPADCDIRFKVVTAWERYRWQILAMLAVIFAQAALIVALALNRRRLRQAQCVLADECNRRTRAEAIAAGMRDRLARFGKQWSLGTMATAMSHEINQPLVAIQNYAQAAKRRLQSNVDDKPKLAELVSKIEGQAERAGDIVRRVRSLVDRSDLQLQPVHPDSLLEEVFRVMEPEIDNRGCRIDLQYNGALPAVLADPLQAQLVLVNLLQNAMRACADSGIEKRLSVDVRTVEDSAVQFSIVDRGPGVPPDQVAEIFEPLFSGSHGHMGMGLAVSRAIVEAHGGRLWYEPNPAGGAIFRFTLRPARG